MFVVNHSDEPAEVDDHGVATCVTDSTVDERLTVPAGRRRRGAGGLMLAAQRRARILAQLERDGIVRVSDLVGTARGLRHDHPPGPAARSTSRASLEKVHGGAVVRAEPSTAEPGFEAKSARQLAQKEAIAARAAQLVTRGRRSRSRRAPRRTRSPGTWSTSPDLTVVTNSVWVADVLHRCRPRAASRCCSPAACAPRRTRWSGRWRSPRSSRCTSTRCSWGCTAWTPSRLQHPQPARGRDQPGDDRQRPAADRASPTPPSGAWSG